MDGYITEVRIRFGHKDPTKQQHSPHKHRPITYGAKAQLVTDEADTSPPLDAAGIKRVQGIVGCLLYYAQAVDNKLLCTLSAIGMNQASATQNTLAECDQLLDHLAHHPNNNITFKASNMILAAHSDASYLSESKSRSRAGAHIFLSNDDPIPQSNGLVLSIAAVMRSVYASAGEAKLAALFIAAREMRHGLAPTEKPYPNGQLNSCWGDQQHNFSPPEQNDGYADLVAPVPRFPRPVLLLLGLWSKELGRLAH
jgi:hypothetical protein